MFNDISGDADVTRSETLVLGKGLVLFARVDPDLKLFVAVNLNLFLRHTARSCLLIQGST